MRVLQLVGILCCIVASASGCAGVTSEGLTKVIDNSNPFAVRDRDGNCALATTVPTFGMLFATLADDECSPYKQREKALASVKKAQDEERQRLQKEAASRN